MVAPARFELAHRRVKVVCVTASPRSNKLLAIWVPLIGYITLHQPENLPHKKEYRLIIYKHWLSFTVVLSPINNYSHW